MHSSCGKWLAASTSCIQKTVLCTPWSAGLWRTLNFPKLGYPWKWSDQRWSDQCFFCPKISKFTSRWNDLFTKFLVSFVKTSGVCGTNCWFLFHVWSKGTACEETKGCSKYAASIGFVYCISCHYLSLFKLCCNKVTDFFILSPFHSVKTYVSVLYFLRSTAARIKGPQSNLALRLKDETCHHQKDFCFWPTNKLYP